MVLTDGDEVVGVQTLQIRGHLRDPRLDVLVATQGLTPRLVDQIPGNNNWILPVDLYSSWSGQGLQE